MGRDEGLESSKLEICEFLASRGRMSRVKTESLQVEVERVRKERSAVNVRIYLDDLYSRISVKVKTDPETKKRMKEVQDEINNEND
jgi:hypothetical protein